jgi:hypothetical protein
MNKIAIKEFLQSVLPLLTGPMVAFATVGLMKKLILESNKFLGGVAGLAGKITQAAENRAKQSSSYQRRQMSKQQLEQERQRTARESFATSLTQGGVRGAIARRRAAGGITGLVFNRNQAGQQRVMQSAEDALRKQRHEEAERAQKRMTTLGVEGDDDLYAIASGIGVRNGVFRQERNGVETGVQMQVSESEQQAAINALVAQGRVGRLRRLEAVSSRGPGGTPQTRLHRMLDEAYSGGGKVTDKAPDLMPNRRATEGAAAFTKVQPNDVATWHESTVSEAERFYDTTGDRGAQQETLLAFAVAASNPSTLAQLDPDQVRNFRNMMRRYQASGGAISADAERKINDAYNKRTGGNAITDPVAALPPRPVA